MKQTVTGSCHCGAMRFEADVDVSGSSGRCNCSICQKKRSWEFMVKPEDFRDLSDPGAVAVYRFGEVMEHKFCKTCGVAPFSSGVLDVLGGPFCTVAVTCIDGLSPEQLADIPVGYSDGRHDNWTQAPAVTSYL